MKGILRDSIHFIIQLYDKTEVCYLLATPATPLLGGMVDVTVIVIVGQDHLMILSLSSVSSHGTRCTIWRRPSTMMW